MNKKIDELFASTWGLLVFSILSSLGYYFFVLSVIMSFSRGGTPFVGIMFAPAIIGYIAIAIVKMLKNNILGEAYKKK